jgi:hypothetical protein
MIFRHCWKCNQRWELGTASACKCPDETPQRPWVGLTDAEILVKCESVPDYDIGNHDLIQFARAIEAKLKEKNT